MTHFNNTTQAEEIFREKKIVKNPIKFKISLNDEQKEANEQRKRDEENERQEED